MKETNVMDKIQRDLIKKYHTLAGQLGMTDEDRRAMLSQYNVESSRDLSQHQLIDVCGTLAEELERRYGKDSMSVLRKRLIAVVGKYLKACGREAVDIAYIKATACRAAEIKEFNRIPRERLRSLYGAFTLKLKDIKRVEAMYREGQQW